MSKVFNAVLDLAGIILLAICAIGIVGLGSFFTTITLMFGWKALIGLIVILSVLHVIDSGFEAVLGSPFRLLGKVLPSQKQNKPQPLTPEQSDKIKKLKLWAQGLFAFGVVIALVQFGVQSFWFT